MMKLNEDITPTPERFEEGDLILVGKIWQKKYKAHVDFLAAEGRLGGWDERIFRLKSAERLYADWVGSEYNPRVTINPERVPGRGIRCDENVDRMTRQDRYMYVMRKIGKYAEIVRFFVIEDGNAAQFLKKRGIRRPSCRHFRVVWRELCKGLDSLSGAYRDFYFEHGDIKKWWE
nr:MAG TPA: hypothetical protein [Caudoviricetes sp.]